MRRRYLSWRPGTQFDRNAQAKRFTRKGSVPRGRAKYVPHYSGPEIAARLNRMYGGRRRRRR